MSIKEQVLSLLEAERGCHLSGAEIAAKLGVSRNAVWKTVRQLESEGHKIDAVPNRGYALCPESSVLSVPGIRKHLRHKELVLDYQKTVTTTMAVAKQAAEMGATEGYVSIAESQTAGKGRMGRSFYSPAGSGVYFSIVLRPNFNAEQSLLITTCAAVAVAQAVETITRQDAKIKWVNDIYVNGKKVCGILTEASIDIENGGLHYAVLGIGINLMPPEGGFPEDILNKAGALLDDNISGDLSCRMVAAVLDRFFDLYPNILERSFLEEYRRRSILTGQCVDVLRGESVRPATVEGIDDDFALIVTYEDGSTAHLSSGDVSIRKK